MLSKIIIEITGKPHYITFAVYFKDENKKLKWEKYCVLLECIKGIKFGDFHDFDHFREILFRNSQPQNHEIKYPQN